MLYVVATPIGNLEDISFRAIKTLSQVDLIAAEDTRHTRKLLTHYEINTPSTSYHEHNKIRKTHQLIEKLKQGQSLALVSDAGMPGISDPGFYLIRAARAESLEITVIPGPTAFVNALLLSGAALDQFAFYGFLPPKPEKKLNVCLKLKKRG